MIWETSKHKRSPNNCTVGERVPRSLLGWRDAAAYAAKGGRHGEAATPVVQLGADKKAKAADWVMHAPREGLRARCVESRSRLNEIRLGLDQHDHHHRPRPRMRHPW